MLNNNDFRKRPSGFTLLELLIVISIIAILAVILVIALNPAETLRKARDIQRISDLNTLKAALAIYVTSVSNPELGGPGNDFCIGNIGAKPMYSNSRVGDTDADDLYKIDGTGWIPVDFTAIAGGSPISNLPVDPVNSATNSGFSGLIYRYACHADDLTFELNARLESATYGPGGEDDKSAKDGGDSPDLYEVGTSLGLFDEDGNI